MDDYYLKYAEDIPYPIPSVEIIKENYINVWKNNIINELFVLKSLFLEEYSLNLNEKIIQLVKNISSLIEQYRYLFLEQYLYYLNNDDKFYININDNMNIFKIKFLKEGYNRILLLIDNLCSCNKMLSLIYQDKLNNYAIDNNLISKNLQIQINNEEILNKLDSDIKLIKKSFENKKNIFNFKNNQNMIYPKSEELNKLFEEFNTNNYNNNLEIQKKISKCPNKIIKDKLLSRKTDIVIRQNNPKFDELLKISNYIQRIKDDIRDIKEKQKNYCASSVIEKNYFKEEFNNIKENRIKINNEINGLKDEVKEYNNKYIKMRNNIENFNNKYKDIKKINDDLNNKITIFLKQYK